MSPHKHFLNILKYFAIVAIGFSFAYGENVMAASSNALTVPSETTVNVAADQDSGANIEGSLIIAQSTCAAGYTVSVSGGTDNNLYLNGDSTSEYIAPSTGTRLAPTTIIGEGKLNTWGISMSETIDVHSNTFFGLTNEMVPIYSKDSASVDGGDQIKVYYGASVSSDKQAGLYKMAEGNTITYYLTTPVSCHSITIVYDGNGADDGNDMAVQHENVDLGDSLDLYASNYKRAGYGFAGWSTEQLDPNSATFANDLASAVSDGLVFGPNETITVNEDIMAYANPETNLLPLYAVWIRSAGNIQDWAGCSAMREGDITALTDTRDNNVYTVAKLADGNCWMAENLRLDNTASINNSNTNNPISGFTLQNSTNPSNWCENSTDACISQSIVNTDNTTSTIADMTSADQSIYSYGNYYNWYSATAGNGTYNSTSGESAGDLCPAGWKLPTGSAGGTYSELDILLGGTGSYQTGDDAAAQSIEWRKFPINRVLSGLVTTSISRGLGSFSWTSTAKSTSGANGFRLYSDGTTNDIYPGTQLPYKYRGSSIRCIARNIYSVVYNGNNSDSGIGMSVQHNNVETGNSIDLYAPNYKKAGYGFVGWSTEQLNPNSASFVNELTAARNAGLVFGPNETISFNRTIASKANNNNVVTLYAVWMQSAGNIQNWNGCSTLDIGGITALTDTRDNNVYAVAKLADDNCWMIENLRLGTTGSDDETKAQGFGDVFAGLADPEIANFIDSTVANSLYYSGTQSGSATIDIGTTVYPEYRFPRFSNINTTFAVESMTSHDQNVYSYGNYYSWAAAKANTNNYSTIAESDAANTSICPAGWILPFGSQTISKYSFGALSVSLGGSSDGSTMDGATAPTGSEISAAFRSFPNNFVHSGRFSDSSVGARTASGMYWTNTTYSYGGAYYLYFTKDELRPGNSTVSKGRGNAVRCLMQNSYTITYNGNNADSGIGMSVEHSDVKKGDEVSLYAANYKKAGYGFAGWSTEQLNPNSATFADDLADAVNSGLVFGPNETITLNNAIIAKADEDGEIPVYAIWVASAGNIQNWNGCSAMQVGSVTALTDTRDNQVYAVAKLADGKCWMIENLRLSADDSRGTNRFNPSLTNDSLAQGYAASTVYGDFVGLADAESSNFGNSVVANSIYSTDGSTSNVIRGGSTSYYHQRIPRYNNMNTLNPDSYALSGDANIYSYGNYYSWAAAIADVSEYRNNDQSVTSFSICPSGWRLPRGGNKDEIENNGSNDFWNLMVVNLGNGVLPNNYNDIDQPYYQTAEEAQTINDSVKKYPNNFVNSGHFQGSTTVGRGDYTAYWSSTARSNPTAYRLHSGGQMVVPGTYDVDKYFGYAIRCIVGS